ncbi:MAG: hypothetical protein JO156_16795 [Solirubrobacterales bacterium]|nr:hypothetical protein [Solirubrobacterales bacterium]
MRWTRRPGPAAPLRSSPRRAVRRVDGEPAHGGWLWTEVRRRAERWRAVHHPFLQRWRAGELSWVELQAYASEHHHAVVALASASRHAAQLADGPLADSLWRRAADDAREIELWCDFAAATGWCEASSWYFAQDPLPSTTACSQACSGGMGRSLGEHLMILYALDSTQRDAVSLQLDAHGSYQLCDRRAVQYFRRRTERAGAGAAQAKAALAAAAPANDELALLRCAETTYRSYWELLDGVQALSREPMAALAS